MNRSTKHNDWISKVRRKVLYRPSSQFFNNLREMEQLFKSFHGAQLKAGVNGITRLINIFRELSIDVPEEVMQFFIRSRIHFRVKTLNSHRRLKYLNKGVNKMKKKKKKKSSVIQQKFANICKLKILKM